MAKRPRFEVCVDHHDSIRAAADVGVERIELCASLLEGGLTPPRSLLRFARRAFPGEVLVMVRPRGGDFVVDDDVFAAMRDDVALARDEGADGVVIGLLHADGSLDVERLSRLVEDAGPLPVTLHRVIDVCRDLEEALGVVRTLGIARVLSSGQAPTAFEGAATLAQMVIWAQNDFDVVAGAGVKPEHAAALVDATGVGDLHFSGSMSIPGPMTFRRPEVHMGAGDDDAVRRVTTPARLQAYLDAFGASAGRT